MRSKWLLLGVFGVALLVNPYLACSSTAEPDFTYSEADMKQALLGTWQGTAELDGEVVPFSLVVEQAPAAKARSLSPPKQEPQCGSRSFVKPAAACASLSSMPVVGTLTSENPAFNGAVDGSFTAYRSLDTARLELRLESGSVLFGTISDQALRDGHVSQGASGVFSLGRP